MNSSRVPFRMSTLSTTIVGTVVVLGFAGCAAQKEKSVAPEELKAELISFVDGTVEVLETDGWTESGSSVSLQPCSLGGLDDGVNFDYVRIGPGTTDAERTVRIVEEFWEQNGLRTKVVRSDNPKDVTVRLYGAGGQIRVIDFYADERATSFGAESVCIPGPFSDVVDRMGEVRN